MLPHKKKSFLRRMVTKVFNGPQSPAAVPPAADTTATAAAAADDRPVTRRHSAIGVLSHTTPLVSSGAASVSQDDNQLQQHQQKQNPSELKEVTPTIDIASSRLPRSMSEPINVDAVAVDSDALAELLMPATKSVDAGNQQAESSASEGGEEEFEELGFDYEIADGDALENDENQDGNAALARSESNGSASGKKNSIRVSLGLSTSEGLMGHANEDRMVVEQNEFFHLFAVLDGHGGEWVADFVKAKLFPVVARCYDHGFNQKELADAIDALDAEVQAKATQIQDYSGACMVCVLLFVDEATGAPQTLTLNVGDCRAIMHEARGKGKKDNKGMGPNGKLYALSEDHCEENAKETARVLASGAYIEYGRLGGVLEPFRSIGDIDMKEREMDGWVIATPEIKKTRLLLGRSTLILATDGVWGSLANQKVMAIARKHTKDPQAAADAIVSAARGAGSMDDIAVVVAHV